MAKICVITDSSVALMPEEAKKLGIELAPLNIIIDGVSGVDLFEVKPEDVEKALKAGKDVSTSQPNLGYLEDLFERIKSENYDHIFVFTLPAYLSGTFSVVQLAAANKDVKNISFYDTKSAAGGIRHLGVTAQKMAQAGKTVEEIKAYCQKAIEGSITYILPDNLDQLKKNGRVKGATAALSNLLKIKLCVYIAYETNAIEKFGTDRVERKLYQSVYDDMIKRGFSASTHKIYLPHTDALSRLEVFKAFLLDKDPTTEFEVMHLPAGIAAHVGLGTFGCQIILKA